VERQCAEIARHKPDLVITEKGLSDLAMHFLTKAGISAIRRLRTTDNNRVARATGATIVHRRAPRPGALRAGGLFTIIAFAVGLGIRLAGDGDHLGGWAAVPTWWCPSCVSNWSTTSRTHQRNECSCCRALYCACGRHAALPATFTVPVLFSWK